MLNNAFRVLWLLNKKELRESDVAQLKSVGVTEFFMPKKFPATPYNLSDDIDFSYDDSLSIPVSDLEVLNRQNWYEDPSDEAWGIVNRYFDVAFVGSHAQQLLAALKGFGGAIVLRGAGFLDGKSYSDALHNDLGEDGVYRLKAVGNRLWFGAFHAHQAKAEMNYLSRRLCCLPVEYAFKSSDGYSNRQINNVLFFCPNINVSEFSLGLYKNFLADFKGFDYSVAGQQPIAVDADNIIGEINFESKDCISNQYKVMFYDSTVSNRIDDMPLRAMRSGIALVFMAGGMLDDLGGIKSPGRSKTIEEARKKIRRILEGDNEFIASIIDNQKKILDKFSTVVVSQQWRRGWADITNELEAIRAQNAERPKKRKRIAIIVPVKYRGGSLRGTKMLAQALYIGSRQGGEDVDVVICHLDDKESYSRDTFDDIDANIKIRPYKWRTLDAIEARRAMRYSGQQGWEPIHSKYVAPDDGIKQLVDCDLWIVISDRLEAPLLPIKPTIYMVYDYLQRYEPILTKGADAVFLDAVRVSKKVFVTTNFTKFDALQYAGVSAGKVVVMPMLVPEFWKESVIKTEKGLPYFIWTTNANQHKNHVNALKALRIYYEEYGGSLSCHVTGVGTENLLKSDMPHLKPLAKLVKGSPLLSRRMRLLGELSESQYIDTLANSRFLWHAGKIDNGTFSVIEAACVGIPSLSSDYPAMHEIDARFSLNLTWMNSGDPKDMAKKLKYMEENYFNLTAKLPSKEKLAQNDLVNFAVKYWDEVRVCL
ncbi:glycosyltransferase family 4 protein [Pseudomonas sp. H3(2019)]|uniref:glycosyltransferase family 4 protein n=1 Tax=Pseudomonas sp. H3(2019) TaxID=2598724 RepID=UPI0011911BA0|nr:glycosyltransferase family 4 protein [Pseudomonas sp. H3(2019)]TVT82777.1 glycosyltransferase family 4 protein [Pseudomonas sp. H3(2019)]